MFWEFLIENLSKTSRQPCLGPTEQQNGCHIGVPNQSCGRCTRSSVPINLHDRWPRVCEHSLKKVFNFEYCVSFVLIGSPSLGF